MAQAQENAPDKGAGEPSASVSPAPAATAPAPSADKAGSVVEASVVKVFSTVRYPDYYKPWTKQAPSEITGSGVVIEGKRILTNAHVVLYASQVQIQANQAGDKISARVEAIAPGIDLAVLKLDDEQFFDTHAPLPRAKFLPEVKDAVMTYGYPTGGTSLSITKGIVSRVDFARYNNQTSGLRIQIDAAINPGNSGGPAVVGDQMIGLAFSHLRDAQNIGYIIPCEEIDLFLQSIAEGRYDANGHYDSKPILFDYLQTLEDPAIRPFLKIDKSVEGIIVHKPITGAPSYPLKEWDVITKIGNIPVDDQGMTKLGNNLRVSFRYWVQKIAKQEKVPLTIVRAGKPMEIQLPVPTNRPKVVSSLEGTYPSYFVYGPLVFSELTAEFFGGFNKVYSGRYTTMLDLVKRVEDDPAFEGERQVVISSPFFPHKVSTGYSNPAGEIVTKINGISIKNLAHLVLVLRDLKDEFVKIEFERKSSETFVFRRAEMLAATDEILSDNGVRSQGSPDVLAIWKAQQPK